jgi:hypothetical protein
MKCASTDTERSSTDSSAVTCIMIITCTVALTTLGTTAALLRALGTTLPSAGMIAFIVVVQNCAKVKKCVERSILLLSLYAAMSCARLYYAMLENDCSMLCPPCENLYFKSLHLSFVLQQTPLIVQVSKLVHCGLPL